MKLPFTISDLPTQSNFDELVKRLGLERIKRGAASLPFASGSASGSITVTHGLGATPVTVLVSQNGTGGPSPVVLQVDTIGATTFRLYGEFRTGTAASNLSVTVGWAAIA